MDQAAVEDHDVEPAIVVEVVNSRAPAGVLRGRLRDSGTWPDIFESVCSGVAHQAVVLRVGHPEIHAPVAVDIGKYRTHGGSVLAILSVGDTLFGSDFLKRAVVLIVEEEVLGLIVGNVNVGITIAVVIRGRDAHGAAFVGADSGLVGHVGEGSVAVVVIKAVGLGGVVERAGIVVGGIVVAILGIELHVAADEEIGTTVTVVIEPSGADRPAVNIDPSFFGHIFEGAVAAVAIENRPAVAGHEQIDKAVVVEIGGDCGHSINVGGNTRLLGDIGER